MSPESRENGRPDFNVREDHDAAGRRLSIGIEDRHGRRDPRLREAQHFGVFVVPFVRTKPERMGDATVFAGLEGLITEVVTMPADQKLGGRAEDRSAGGAVRFVVDRRAGKVVSRVDAPLLPGCSKLDGRAPSGKVYGAVRNKRENGVAFLPSVMISDVPQHPRDAGVFHEPTHEPASGMLRGVLIGVEPH